MRRKRRICTSSSMTRMRAADCGGLRVAALIADRLVRRTRRLVQRQVYGDGCAFPVTSRQRLDTSAVCANHAVTNGETESAAVRTLTVSYTHLTLPTIYS